MNVQEWKAATRKTVELKSGLIVTVRRMSPFAINEKGGLPGIENIPPGSEWDLTAQILRAAIIDPPVGHGPDQIDLLDLDSEDTGALMNAVIGKTEGGERGGIPLAHTDSNGTPPSS